MTTVLITGSEDRTAAVAAAIEAAGAHAVTAGGGEALRDAVRDLGNEQFDAFVQLPVEIASSATTAIGRVRDLLAEGLVTRFADAETALPAIADGGTVLLVAGNSPGDRGLADDQRARYSLLRVLGHAILADRPGGGVRATVLPASTSPDDIANHVLGRPTAHAQAIATFVAESTEESYADWRVDLLSIATTES